MHWSSSGSYRRYAFAHVILSYDNKASQHYSDIIMGAIVFQITSLTIVYSTVYSDADQRKHQSSASLAFVRGIHRGPVNSPHKWPVTRKMFPFDDVIMSKIHNDINKRHINSPFPRVFAICFPLYPSMVVLMRKSNRYCQIDFLVLFHYCVFGSVFSRKIHTLTTGAPFH